MRSSRQNAVRTIRNRRDRNQHHKHYCDTYTSPTTWSHYRTACAVAPPFAFVNKAGTYLKPAGIPGGQQTAHSRQSPIRADCGEFGKFVAICEAEGERPRGAGDGEEPIPDSHQLEQIAENSASLLRFVKRKERGRAGPATGGGERRNGCRGSTPRLAMEGGGIISNCGGVARVPRVGDWRHEWQRGRLSRRLGGRLRCRAASGGRGRRRNRSAQPPGRSPSGTLGRTTRSPTANPPRPAPIAARSAAHRPPMLEIPPADPIDPAQKRPPHAPGNAVIRPDIGGIEDQFAGQRRHLCSPCPITVHGHTFMSSPKDEKSPKGRKKARRMAKIARRSKR